MTRKDYIALAQALTVTRRDRKQSEETWREAVQNIADVLQADNGRFNRRRFLVACGLLPKE